MYEKDILQNKTSGDDPSEEISASSQKLQILITHADMYSTDITAMSNFYDIYIEQLSLELRTNTASEIIANIPLSDIGIINDVVQHADAIMAGEFSLLPDFDHLPKEVKEKLDQGLYTVGESRQVDGNLRAVILDEEGVRVKDITLKQVRNDPGTLATTRSITNQLQMRQLAAKLDDIEELQSYQIDRDRDRDIITPFLNARDFILRAQEQNRLEGRQQYLLKASDAMTGALNAVYTDISTTSTHLAKMASRPIFQNRKRINSYMGMLVGDLQVATKFVGVQMHVLDCLGDAPSARQVSKRYQNVMNDFFIRRIGPKRQSAAMLLHMNFPYTDQNRDSWYNLKKEIGPALSAATLITEQKPVYLVSVEDANNGGEEF